MLVVVVYGRPVVGPLDHITCFSTEAFTGQGQHHASGLFHQSPLAVAESVLERVLTEAVHRVGQRHSLGMDVGVGEEDEAVHAMNRSAAVAGVLRAVERLGHSGVEQIDPFLVGQRAPHSGFVATVADGVEHAPVGVGVSTREVVLGVTAKIVVYRSRRGERLTAGGARLPTTGAPAEEVNPSVVGRRDVVVQRTNDVVLMFGKAPCARRGAVLEVASRETHP